MTDFVSFLFIGLGAGGIYALTALGITVVYRGSGIVNFAHGALVLIAAAVYYELAESHGAVIAVLLGVLAAVVGALLIQLCVLYPMRKASPLARVIATLGIMSAVEAAALLRYGRTGHFVDGFLPVDAIKLTDDVVIGADRLAILVIVVVLAIPLALLYSRTRFGAATTAVAENERAVAAMGWSPAVLSLVNWAIGGALAGVAGVLLVSITGLDPHAPSSLIVPALAVCLIGGFASLPLTVAGGLALGVMEAEVTNYVSATGWNVAVPFLVIILLQVFRGRALPLRSHTSDRLPRLGKAQISWRAIAIFSVVCVVFLFLAERNWQVAFASSAAFALICLSVVLLVGMAGQLSLAQFAFAGLGAWTASRLADAANWPFPAALAAGVAAATVAGVVVGLPAVRVRGVNLAVVTLGFSSVFAAVVLSNSSFTGGPITGTIIPEPKLFGVDVSAWNEPRRYGLVVLFALIVGLILVANIRRGRIGRRLIAVRGNERAAASLGISSVAVKVYAFTVSAALASLGGILLAFVYPNIVFDQFDTAGSINVVLSSVIGGVGFLTGGLQGGLAVPGGLIVELIDTWADIGDMFTFIMALVLIVTVILNPHGISAAVSDQYQWLKSRIGRGSSSLEQGVDSKRLDVAAGEDAVVAVHRVEPQSLVLNDVTVRFGTVTALDSVSLTVNPGEVVGLIGPNGAGKTTLIDAATGFVSVAGGSVTFAGNDVTRMKASHRARTGMTRSFQSLELIEDLTVAENLQLGADPHDRLSYLRDMVWPKRMPHSSAAAAAIEEFGLDPYLRQHPSELPYGVRRLVAIARAVTASPSVLLLDEPAAGLGADDTRELAHLIRRLAEQWGLGILLIEHDVELVMGVSDRIVAISFGKHLATGTPDEVRNTPSVIAAYLGASTDEVDSSTPPGMTHATVKASTATAVEADA
ncbi:branched-chain amino acid ABC transporter permease/ATP-binding protein [Rhodococcoides fascians]|uniref:branched-chain amino acid ABC transporter permease/ATP-binding protein n=1 Tax=Rhodococcoides fascians TaxID=1828 RepID=UPI00056720F8|nr:branched-chain amino acid ABC transporter permease/ATP-binding protein [Rhodococcus fascians]